MPNHLELPAPFRSPSRRAGGGGGSLPVRHSRATHAQELARGLEAIPVRPTEVDSIDPDLTFKFSAASRLPETVLEAQGMEILGEDEEWTYFVLLDSDSRQHFLEALSAFGATEKGPVTDMTAGLLRAIQIIDGIELYGPEDRLAADLEPPEGTDTIEVHVRIWPAADSEEAAQRVRQVVQVIDSADGCRFLASSAGAQTAAVVAEVNEMGLGLLSELSVVEKISPPIVMAFTSSQIEQAEVDDVPAPRGAPVGVLDDAPSTANRLMAAVVTATASFPDRGRHTWNPPGPHGTAVASLAAFYDFEEPIANAVGLRTPHPVISARIMEPAVPGGLETRVPYGTVFPTSVEDAVRWTRSQGARVVSMSVNRNSPAPLGAPRDELTFVLDTLARELDMVIVLSAGNTTSTLYRDHLLGQHVDHDYPSYLSVSDAGIGEPGLATNALTVGGEARQALSALPGYRGIAPVGGPSPFTRTGVNSSVGRVKPDLVHWAGNWAWHEQLGQLNRFDPSLSTVVAAVEPGRLFDWSCGTSFAAPRVAYIAAEVLTHYPHASANLVRALVLLSARQSQGLRSLIGDRAEQRRMCGAGLPNLNLAVSSGGSRVVLTFEGEIDCDTTVIHPIPIPVEYTRGRHRRQIRVAIAYDPPVRRTRREYIAGHLQIVLLRSIGQDDVLDIFRHQPSAQARQKDPALTAVPLPNDRRRIALQPGPDDVTRTTAYVREFSTVQLQEDDGDTYYLAVTHQKSPWRNLADYEKQKYGVAIELVDERQPSINLYNLVRARLQAQIRQRTR